MTKNYTVNFETMTIDCTASFMKKAGTYGTNEYRELLNLRHDLPEYSVQVVKANSNRKASKYKNLTIANMREYIRSFHGDDEVAVKDALAQMDKIRALARIEANPYKKVAEWFTKTYPEARTQIESEEEKAN